MHLTTSKKSEVVWFLIRLAIAFAFFYPAVRIHSDPDSWLGYFPAFVKDIGIPTSFLIAGFSVVHIIIGTWILSGKKIFLPSIFATIFLGMVIFFNLNQIDILFRDVSLFLVSLALAILSTTSKEIM